MTHSAIHGRIGPNAIIQLGESFAAHQEMRRAEVIYAAAGCLPLLVKPPMEMVDQTTVARLFHAVAEGMDVADAKAYLTEAGTRTGDYILANRIPRLVRLVLPLLPARLGLKVLLNAIQRHAWTFAGSGIFSFATGKHPEVKIMQNPISTALGCPWHEAVFARIFSRLIRGGVRVHETRCCGQGDGCCRFEIELEA